VSALLNKLISVGGSQAQQAAALATPLDILVGTPQKIVQQAEKGHLFFGDVQYVVLDEADTMFDKGFGPEVRALLNPVRKKEQPAVCILVLATLKKANPFPLDYFSHSQKLCIKLRCFLPIHSELLVVTCNYVL
jgi:superfamily II DNA/RNA helicase